MFDQAKSDQQDERLDRQTGRDRERQRETEPERDLEPEPAEQER